MNVLICCDEEDPTVGHFVELCADKAHEIMDDIDIEVERLNSVQLSASSVSKVANRNGDAPFVCTAFSHGTDNSLLCNSDDYIAANVNQHSFRNVFFYTWACSTANNLGGVLIASGCATYIGYLESVRIPSPSDAIIDIFVECAISGLRAFWEDKLTAVDSFNFMLDTFDEKIDELSLEDPLATSFLLEHQTSIDILGNEAVTWEALFDTI